MRGILLLLPALVAACAPASRYHPAVTLDPEDQARFEIDLSDCKRAAERDRYAPVFAAVLQGAALGTALGAAITGVGVANFGAVNVGAGESYGAIAGAAAGAGFGTSQVQEPPDERQAVDQCLRNNGYTLRGP